MHTLGIKGEDDAKGVATFWITEIIDNAHPTVAKFPSWGVKIACSESDLHILLNRGIFGISWSPSSISQGFKAAASKASVGGLIALMDDEDERE